MYKQGKNVLIYATLFLMLIVVSTACTQVTPVDPQADPIYTFARQRIEETRRQQRTQMPAWLKKNREVLRDQMAVVAQNPEVKRHTPGNRDDYSAEAINVKYIPGILAMLGAGLPRPVNVASHADAGDDTFDELWEWIPQWMTSPSGMFPVLAAREVALSFDTDGKTGEGSLTFLLTKEQLEELKEPYLSATWSGFFEVLLNGEPVKTIQYNLADV